VNEAINSLNYRPNKLARALTQKDIPLLALIVPDISNPYWSSLARAVQDISDRNDYSVIVCSSDGLLERETRFLNTLSGWVSGLIFHPYQIIHDQLSPLIETHLPAVILGDFSTAGQLEASWDQVSSNNQESARAATGCLISLGHRRIAFIGGLAGTPSSLKRLAGFREALEMSGLPADDSLIIPGDYTQAGGRKAMTALLDQPDPPTAVFCANDLSAFGAMEEAKSRGLQIPQDLSIMGFDDIDEAAFSIPPLSTVRLPPREIGIVAAETLIERLKGRTEPTHVAIKGSLVIRETTTAPRFVGESGVR
jgi:LacI family transcriptional regulator